MSKNNFLKQYYNEKIGFIELIGIIGLVTSIFLQIPNKEESIGLSIVQCGFIVVFLIALSFFAYDLLKHLENSKDFTYEHILYYLVIILVFIIIIAFLSYTLAHYNRELIIIGLIYIPLQMFLLGISLKHERCYSKGVTIKNGEIIINHTWTKKESILTFGGALLLITLLFAIDNLINIPRYYNYIVNLSKDNFLDLIRFQENWNIFTLYLHKVLNFLYQFSLAISNLLEYISDLVIELLNYIKNIANKTL